MIKHSMLAVNGKWELPVLCFNYFQVISQMCQNTSSEKQQVWSHESTKLLLISIHARNAGVICDAAAAECQILFRTPTFTVSAKRSKSTT